MKLEVVSCKDLVYITLSLLFFVTFVVMTVGVWMIKGEVTELKSAFGTLDDLVLLLAQQNAQNGG